LIGLPRLHLVKEVGETFRFSPPPDDSPQVPSIGGTNRASGNGDFDRDDLFALDRNNLHAAAVRGPRSIGNQRLYAARIGMARGMARLGAGDSPVIFYTNEKPCGLLSKAIRKTDHSVNQSVIGEPAVFFALEFNGESLSVSNQLQQAFWCHRLDPKIQRRQGMCTCRVGGSRGSE
jgi:hypothetical protein